MNIRELLWDAAKPGRKNKRSGYFYMVCKLWRCPFPFSLSAGFEAFKLLFLFHQRQLLRAGKLLNLVFPL